MKEISITIKAILILFALFILGGITGSIEIAFVLMFVIFAVVALKKKAGNK